MQNQKENKIQRITIPACHTYMIQEVDSATLDQLKLSLITGQAEILGMQLKKHYPLKFNMPCIVLIFTWEGCEIEAEWPEDKNSSSSEDWLDITLNSHIPESPIVKYFHLHYQLTLARRLAQEKFIKGPRLAIVGGQNSGLAYSSRLLLTWAGKMNMKPLYVDLDLDNSLFLDGSIGTCIYEYKVTTEDEPYRHCQRLSMVYGNRRIRNFSFVESAKTLTKHINKRLTTQLQGVKLKGSKEEINSFASGLIVQCPRISDDKRNIKEMLVDLFKVFDITHVLIIDNPDLSGFISRNCPELQKEVAPKMEGIDNLLKLPKTPKVKAFIGKQTQITEKMPLQDIVLYEIMEEEHRPPYVRVVDVRTERINKTGIAIIDSQKAQEGENPQKIADRCLQNVAISAIRISHIGDTEMTFDVKIKGDLERFKNKLWVSMIAERTY